MSRHATTRVTTGFSVPIVRTSRSAQAVAGQFDHRGQPFDVDA